MTASATARRPSLTAVGRSFWSWWLGELRDLVPAWLGRERRHRLDADIRLDRDLWTIRDRRGLTMSLDPQDGPTVAEALDGLKGRRKQAKVAVTVPLSRCFVRRTDMPRSMLAHAGAILGTELDTATPFHGASVHWDWFAHGPGAAPGHVGVTQVVLKRRDTEPLTDRLADSGVVAVRIAVVDESAVPHRRLPIDLLRQNGDAGAGARDQRKARRVLVAAAALASLAIAPVAFSQQSATLAAIDQDLADAKDAVALRPGLARAPLEALGDGLRLKRDMPPASLILDRLAATLPADSYLDHLFLDKDTVTIQGRTHSARGLERALASSPLFSAGHNTAPAPATNTDGTPFTIRLKMKPMPPAPEA